jgi:hypothetical protein
MSVRNRKGIATERDMMHTAVSMEKLSKCFSAEINARMCIYVIRVSVL